MNGDFIAKDVEPDICCEWVNDNCTCDLERVHEQYIRDMGFKPVNIGWAVDEIEQSIQSKVIIREYPGKVLLDTRLSGKDTYQHEILTLSLR